MISNSKVSGTILYVCLLTFLLFAVCILYLNQDVLYTAHDRSEFLIGAPYFNTLMEKPFGLFKYIGGWLSQFFYKPVVGGSMLLCIWGLIFYVGIKAFRLREGAVALMLLPVACLLTSIVDLGYWIYEFTIRGYWFSQSVGFLVMLLLLWAARCTPRSWHVLWYVLGFAIYPFLGWYALLFIACLMISEKPTIAELVGFILIFVSAPVWRMLLYSNLRYDDIFLAGLPRFVTPSNKSDCLTIPFWIIGILSFLYLAVGKYLIKWFVPILCSLAGIVFTLSFMYYDKNYINEMRMVRYAEEDKWQDVLQVYTESQKPTVSMVMLKNVALMYDGSLFDRSFKMGNDHTSIYNPDSVSVSFLEVASPIVYYNYGMLNEGYRLGFECAVQSGFSPFFLKMLTRCAMANREKPLVDRYLRHLHSHPFYSDWQPAPVTTEIQELHKSYPDELTGVENSNKYLVNSICQWYETDCKVASEQALFYSMMRCDSRRFWASLRKYLSLHQNEEFPVHAQEAYILYLDKAPEEKRMKLPVSQSVYDRYKNFWSSLENMVKSGLPRNEIPEKMKEEFGDTYWYFNIFARKI